MAAGGRTIASAPPLPLGQQQLNSLDGIDFWKLHLSLGDRTTIRFGPQTNASYVEVCLLPPGVTDTTVGNTTCQTREAVLQDGSFTFDARPGGDWTVAVLPYPGCESSGILNLRCNSFVSYYLTAFAKHVTHLSLRAPSVARRGSTFYANGQLAGAHGAVVAQQSWNGGRWAASSLVRASASGAFRIRLRPKRSGLLRTRVTYPDGPLYVGSVATTSTRVV
jgi:hypothetical protein